MLQVMSNPLPQPGVSWHVAWFGGEGSGGGGGDGSGDAGDGVEVPGRQGGGGGESDVGFNMQTKLSSPLPVLPALKRQQSAAPVGISSIRIP